MKSPESKLHLIEVKSVAPSLSTQRFCRIHGRKAAQQLERYYDVILTRNPIVPVTKDLVVFDFTEDESGITETSFEEVPEDINVICLILAFNRLF
ncbi:MAG: hypothetical protein U9O89_02560 [Thermoproteota archaeon]|nr:hypothetical protein [Thermoproteota archaeon]